MKTGKVLIYEFSNRNHDTFLFDSSERKTHLTAAIVSCRTYFTELSTGYGNVTVNSRTYLERQWCECAMRFTMLQRISRNTEARFQEHLLTMKRLFSEQIKELP